MQRSSDLLHFYSLLAAGLGFSDATPGEAAEVPHTPVPHAPASQPLSQAAQGAQQPAQAAAAAVVVAMTQRGWTLSDLDGLPFGTALPLRAALLTCRAQPPEGTSHCAMACSRNGAKARVFPARCDHQLTVWNTAMTSSCRPQCCRMAARGVPPGRTRRLGGHECGATASSAPSLGRSAAGGNRHRGLFCCCRHARSPEGALPQVAKGSKVDPDRNQRTESCVSHGPCPGCTAAISAAPARAW